jgi:hypothetical protein
MEPVDKDNMPQTPIFATSTVVRSYADASARTKLASTAGTYTEHRKTIEPVLLLDFGEEMILGGRAVFGLTSVKGHR